MSLARADRWRRACTSRAAQGIDVQHDSRNHGDERRQSGPRVRTGGDGQSGQEVQLSTAESVRVIDLSVGGALLHAREPLPVGSRAQLRLSVGSSPMAADVEVRRVSALAPHAGYHIGARFVAITPQHRQLIERFLTT